MGALPIIAMNPLSLKALPTLCAGAAALAFLSSCATHQSKTVAGGIVKPYTLTRVATPAGIGQIDVVYDTPSDQNYPTTWKLSGFNRFDLPRKVRRTGTSAPVNKRAGTYVVEFANASRSVPPPVVRTVEVQRGQRLTLRVTYSRKPGSKDCQ